MPSPSFRHHFAAPPLLLAEIICASFLIAALNLAFPLYSIQLFDHYLSHGHNGTLYALTAGVGLALLFLHGLVLIRGRMLSVLAKFPDRENGRSAMAALTRIRMAAMDRRTNGLAEVTLDGLQRLTAARGPVTVAALFDFPFSLLYLGAVFYLHPLLGWVGTGFLVAGVVVGLASAIRASRMHRDQTPLEQEQRRLVLQAVHGAETVRLFDGRSFLLRRWQQSMDRALNGRMRLNAGRDRDRATQLSLSMGMYVLLYAVGGVLVVQGKLSIGGLIGANILASRSFRTVSQFAHACYLVIRARRASEQLQEVQRLPSEPDQGTAIRNYSGRIQFDGVTFGFPGGSGPLFENMDFEIGPGTLLVVTGKNGAGKTTLARLFAAILTPVRGEILVDGVALAQAALPWWRRQLVYLPQEPHFLDGTIRDNITLAGPDIDDEDFERILDQADLRFFLDRAPKGIHTPLVEGGRNLPAGIRKRIALARALVTNGRLVIFDEPFENVDAEGKGAMIRVVRQMISEQRSVVLMSADIQGITGAHFLLDLNLKPQPRFIRCDNRGELFGVGT